MFVRKGLFRAVGNYRRDFAAKKCRTINSPVLTNIYDDETVLKTTPFTCLYEIVNAGFLWIGAIYIYSMYFEMSMRTIAQAELQKNPPVQRNNWGKKSYNWIHQWVLYTRFQFKKLYRIHIYIFCFSDGFFDRAINLLAFHWLLHRWNGIVSVFDWANERLTNKNRCTFFLVVSCLPIAEFSRKTNCVHLKS